MFTCARIKATRGKGADFYRQHLSCNDYYSEHEVVKGGWHGSLAEDFGLSNKTVEQSVFSAFQQNINPVSGKKLTARNVENSVRFYDFQCSAQKSVSIMSLFDGRLEKAHQRAVQLAMKEMERFASVRLRSGINANTDNIEFTGNFIYAEYHHNSSRLLDPQLHTHNVIVNVTRDSNGKYKALQSREMVRAIRYASKVYLNKLAEECGLLGYDLEKKYRDKGELVGFEIKGVSEEILKRCSRRREQIDKAIERFVETHGRQPTIDEVGQLTLLTRNRKMLTRTNAQVRDYKLSLFSEEEKAHFKKMVSQALDYGAMCMPWLSDEKRLAAVQKVAAQLFERESVITEDKLLAEVLNQNLGKLKLEELKKDVASLTELVNLGEPSANPYLTTRDHLNHEAEILKLASLLKDFETPLKSGYVPFSESQDTFDHSAQKSVIEDILGSKNKFQIFRGVAGAGKTSTLQELCKCLKHGGIENIHLIAPTNSAVDVLRSEGFGSAQTVAKFLIDPHHLPPDGSYLIVDESGLNSVRQGHDMMQLALQHNYRILFVGDERQHSSVEAGDFFRLLEKYSKIDKTALTEIHRQQDEEYRRGILMASDGDVGGAFDQLDSHGFIHENQGQYLDAAADSFLRLTEDGKRPLDCIAVSPTNRECELLTEKIREKMKSAGCLDAGSERQVEAFRSWSWTAEKIAEVEHYKPGMRVFLTSKIKELGNAGEMFEVKATEGKKLLLSNGQYVNPRQFKDRLDVGEARELAIAKGDVVRLTVNLKTPDFKINNGSLAVATGNPNEFILLDHNRKELRAVRLPENFRGLKYGWVITSHSSQGMTSKNVVVAAEKMSGQAFYVACSRGRKDLSLHVPEKEFFKDRLVKIPTERKLVMDISGGVIPPIPHWKAPVLPPPPDELIGSRLRQFMDRVHEQMRKAQEVIAGYIQRAMYHVFNHNIRKKDHERREQIRKQFRGKCAAIIKLADAERERLAEEQKRAEAERVAAERTAAEQPKPVRAKPQPEAPQISDGWLPSQWEKYENHDFDSRKSRSDADKSDVGQSISTGTSDESRSLRFEDCQKAMADRIAAAERAAAERAAGKQREPSGADAERTTAEQKKTASVQSQPEPPQISDGWLPSQWDKSASNDSDTGKTRSDADKSEAEKFISTGTGWGSKLSTQGDRDPFAIANELSERAYRKLAQENAGQAGNTSNDAAEQTTPEQPKPVRAKPQPEAPQISDGWLPSQSEKYENHDFDSRKSRLDAGKSDVGQTISMGTISGSKLDTPDVRDPFAIAAELSEQTYRKLAQKNAGQSENTSGTNAERTTAEQSKPVKAEPKPIVPEPEKPQHEEQKYEQSRNEHEQPEPEPAGNGTEQSRNEKDDRRAKLVALAEKRKRESPGGIDI